MFHLQFFTLLTQKNPYFTIWVLAGLPKCDAFWKEFGIET